MIHRQVVTIMIAIKTVLTMIVEDGVVDQAAPGVEEILRRMTMMGLMTETLQTKITQ